VAVVAGLALLVGSLIGGGIGATLADHHSSKAPTVIRNVVVPNNTQIAKPQSVPAILAKVEPGVAIIHTDLGAGTGMVLTPAGELLTNYHVIQGASSIRVTLFNETTARTATVKGSDRSNDVALLQITGASNLATVVLGDSDKLQVGDSVVAVGNALDLAGSPSVTDGIVSAKGRSVDPSAPPNLLQTDAAINPGNSGGPLVNADGEVVGMNTLVIQQANSSEAAQNLGFAIPVNTIKPLLPDLAKGVQPASPYLGACLLTMSPDTAARVGIPPSTGALLSCSPQGPAAAAGLQEFDVITRFDGHDVSDDLTLRALIRSHKPGDQVKVDYLRNGVAGTATVTLGNTPVTSH
jgi:S1-C subfamily serine protease